ncbi:uncharacterized protein LOC130800782 isoform X1 [Amaranthus tricolor]|uniref:uncharacterized protein LOC130800782 isoform X1 n=1 Tax=Amaranthus tricolor TaxID=29722 RepID=UPI002590EC63|nr:uncharacterized protein LOC130800782 isoform X1 [Amaranthus tricolor]
MDDWNKPFTTEELVAIDAAFQVAVTSHSSKASRRQNPSFGPNSVSSSSTLCSIKLPFHQEQRKRMVLHGISKNQSSNRYIYSSMYTLQKKRPKLPIAVEKACMVRKWNDMDHDILVNIMNRLRVPPPMFWKGWPDYDDDDGFTYREYYMKGGEMSTLYNSFCVCKSWRLAVLDSVFPPANVLDLHFLKGRYSREKYCYLFYLKALLCRPHQYTKLYFPVCSKIVLLTKVAQRLPKLKCLVQTKDDITCNLFKLIPYWPELNEVHCTTALIPTLSKYCKNIKRMDLYGRIQDRRACILASDFPQLMHLNIQACLLSRNALSIILQRSPNLTYLDTRHAFSVRGSIFDPLEENVIEWDKDEVSRKAVGIKTYLHCAQRYCSYCAPLYSTNISVADSVRFVPPLE